MNKEHKQLREDLIYFLGEYQLYSISREALLKAVKPTSEEVEAYYEAEGGNTERSFETFGVEPDELCFPRGEL